MKNPFGSFAPVFETGTLYLGFLHFDSDDLPEAMRLVRESCAKPSAPDDLRQFAGKQGWREHLILSVSVLANKALAQILTSHIWHAFDHGSWVSPQLAVTAWLRDANFNEESRRRIESLCRPDAQAIQRMPPIERHVIAGPGDNVERGAKGIAALIHLSRLCDKNSSWLPRALDRPDTIDLLKKDFDDGGEVARKWLASVKSRATLLGIELN
jgi:hypothetical protein